MKFTLSSECDEILNKIDDLLNTEVLTFDKALDYRAVPATNTDGSSGSSENERTAHVAIESEENFDFYNNMD